jgi:hypothetical protein
LMITNENNSSKVIPRQTVLVYVAIHRRFRFILMLLAVMGFKSTSFLA